MTVGFITDEAALAHEMPQGHAERAERIAAITDHLDRAGLRDRLEHGPADPAPREVLELAHDPDLLDLLESIDRAGGGRIDRDTSMGPSSLDAARRGAGGAVHATGMVLDGGWDGAFVCMRPPGHHATRSVAMGFCLVDHVAVAARWAISTGAARRVAILDWDAHHGNGTQDIFWSDPDVLYISLHQFPWYPGTGDATERGAADGIGTTINVPLPAGTAEDAFEHAFDALIEPAVERFEPDLVLVSAGYDAHHLDPLCMLRLTSGAFHRMTRRVAGWPGAGPVCVLEGGYDLDALAWGAAATIGAMLGEGEPVGVPAAEVPPMQGEPEATRWVERAVALSRP